MSLFGANPFTDLDEAIRKGRPSSKTSVTVVDRVGKEKVHKAANNNELQKMLKKFETQKRAGVIKSFSYAEPDTENFTVQMRKVVNLRGKYKVHFNDGKSTQLTANQAQAFLSKHNNMQKPADKEALQARASSSEADFKKAISEERQDYFSEAAKEYNFLVVADGLPTFIMKAPSASQVKQKLRKVIKKPDIIKDITRMTVADLRKRFQDLAKKAAKGDSAQEEIEVDDMEESLTEAFKVGDIVTPDKGPHSGEKHKVIYVKGNTYNIKLAGHKPAAQIKYRMGAVNAKASELTLAESNVFAMDRQHAAAKKAAAKAAKRGAALNKSNAKVGMKTRIGEDEDEIEEAIPGSIEAKKKQLAKLERIAKHGRLNSSINKEMIELRKEITKLKMNEDTVEEGKMSDLHMYIDDGKTAEWIARKMKLDVKTIKSLMQNEDMDYIGLVDLVFESAPDLLHDPLYEAKAPYKWDTINTALVNTGWNTPKIMKFLMQLNKDHSKVVAKAKGKEAVTWDQLNISLLGMNMPPNKIAKVLTKLSGIKEEAEEIAEALDASQARAGLIVMVEKEEDNKQPFDKKDDKKSDDKEDKKPGDEDDDKDDDKKAKKAGDDVEPGDSMETPQDQYGDKDASDDKNLTIRRPNMEPKRMKSDIMRRAEKKNAERDDGDGEYFKKNRGSITGKTDAMDLDIDGKSETDKGKDIDKKKDKKPVKETVEFLENTLYEAKYGTGKDINTGSPKAAGSDKFTTKSAKDITKSAKPKKKGFLDYFRKEDIEHSIMELDTEMCAYAYRALSEAGMSKDDFKSHFAKAATGGSQGKRLPAKGMKALQKLAKHGYKQKFGEELELDDIEEIFGLGKKKPPTAQAARSDPAAKAARDAEYKAEIQRHNAELKSKKAARAAEFRSQGIGDKVK